MPSPTVTRLSVTGMHCGSCVALVEESVGELDGVSAVTVSLEDESATVSHDGAKVGVEALCAAVAEVGYRAEPAAPRAAAEAARASDGGSPAAP